MANEKKLIKLEQLDYYNDKILDEISKVAIQVSIMPTLSASLVGTIYQYVGTTSGSTINSHFYKCVEGSTSGTYEWVDTMDSTPTENSTNPVTSGGVYNALAGKQKIMQLSTLPTASSELLGKIYQFVGTTTSSYTNGYFYKCVEGSTSGTYEWQAVNVQAGGSGGSSITQTPTLTLSSSGWDSSTKEQSVMVSSYNLDPDDRQVVDITYTELQTWADNDVKLYTTMVSSPENIYSSFIFKCETIPSTDLTFKITSMEVN